MELKQLTAEQIAQLEAPLPKEAVKPHPSKTYLSTIKPIFVTERLNQVFGLGGWTTHCKVVETSTKPGMRNNQPIDIHVATVDVTLSIPAYGLEYQTYGGSDNEDLGDALKGAVSDATTKIAAVHLHVGLSVYKGEGNAPANHPPVSSNASPRSVEVTPPIQSAEPSKNDLNDVFENAVVPHDEPATQHRERCPKCPGMMDYSEGISKPKKDDYGNDIAGTGGKPWKRWKCSNGSCGHTQFINTK